MPQNTDPPTSPLLTPDEAAQFLRISRRTLDGLEMTRVHISARCKMYDKADLIAYIERNKTWPASTCSNASAKKPTALTAKTNIIRLTSNLDEKPSFSAARAALLKERR